MKGLIAASTVALAFASGTTQAALFSFASDSNASQWTFTGNGANITAATGATPLTLNIDDNNGAAPVIQVNVSFVAQYTLTFVGSVNLPGGAQALSYAANGNFTFSDGANPLLTTTFTNALFSVRASANNVWTTTGSLQVDDGLGATVSMVWGGANLPAYGLAPGALTGTPRGFGFDFTALNSSGAIPYNGEAPGRAIDPTTKLPTGQWWSEGSYSAVANVIPTPGSLALLGLGGLAITRRRR